MAESLSGATNLAPLLQGSDVEDHQNAQDGISNETMVHLAQREASAPTRRQRLPTVRHATLLSTLSQVLWLTIIGANYLWMQDWTCLGIVALVVLAMISPAHIEAYKENYDGYTYPVPRPCFLHGLVFFMAASLIPLGVAHLIGPKSFNLFCGTWTESCKAIAFFWPNFPHITLVNILVRLYTCIVCAVLMWISKLHHHLSHQGLRFCPTPKYTIFVSAFCIFTAAQGMSLLRFFWVPFAFLVFSSSLMSATRVSSAISKVGSYWCGMSMMLSTPILQSLFAASGFSDSILGVALGIKQTRSDFAILAGLFVCLTQFQNSRKVVGPVCFMSNARRQQATDIIDKLSIKIATHRRCFLGLACLLLALSIPSVLNVIWLVVFMMVVLQSRNALHKLWYRVFEIVCVVQCACIYIQGIIIGHHDTAQYDGYRVISLNFTVQVVFVMVFVICNRGLHLLGIGLEEPTLAQNRGPNWVRVSQISTWWGENIVPWLLVVLCLLCVQLLGAKVYIDSHYTFMERAAVLMFAVFFIPFHSRVPSAAIGRIGSILFYGAVGVTLTMYVIVQWPFFGVVATGKSFELSNLLTNIYLASFHVTYLHPTQIYVLILATATIMKRYLSPVTIMSCGPPSWDEILKRLQGDFFMIENWALIWSAMRSHFMTALCSFGCAAVAIERGCLANLILLTLAVWLLVSLFNPRRGILSMIGLSLVGMCFLILQGDMKLMLGKPYIIASIHRYVFAQPADGTHAAQWVALYTLACVALRHLPSKSEGTEAITINASARLPRLSFGSTDDVPALLAGASKVYTLAGHSLNDSWQLMLCGTMLAKRMCRLPMLFWASISMVEDTRSPRPAGNGIDPKFSIINLTFMALFFMQILGPAKRGRIWRRLDFIACIYTGLVVVLLYAKYIELFHFMHGWIDALFMPLGRFWCTNCHLVSIADPFCQLVMPFLWTFVSMTQLVLSNAVATTIRADIPDVIQGLPRASDILPEDWHTISFMYTYTVDLLNFLVVTLIPRFGTEIGMLALLLGSVQMDPIFALPFVLLVGGLLCGSMPAPPSKSYYNFTFFAAAGILQVHWVVSLCLPELEFQVNPVQRLSLWTAFGVVYVIHFCLDIIDNPHPSYNAIDPNVFGLSEMLQQNALAIRQCQKDDRSLHGLMEVLPAPKMLDYTRRHSEDSWATRWVQTLAFKYSSLLFFVLILFKDMIVRFSISYLVEVCFCLILLQSWRLVLRKGNELWKFVVLFYWASMFLATASRLLSFFPGLVRDILIDWGPRQDHWQGWANVSAVIIVLVYLQTYMFNHKGFVFVLYDLHRTQLSERRRAERFVKQRKRAHHNYLLEIQRSREERKLRLQAIREERQAIREQQQAVLQTPAHADEAQRLNALSRASIRVRNHSLRLKQQTPRFHTEDQEVAILGWEHPAEDDESTDTERSSTSSHDSKDDIKYTFEKAKAPEDEYTFEKAKAPEDEYTFEKAKDPEDEYTFEKPKHPQDEGGHNPEGEDTPNPEDDELQKEAELLKCFYEGREVSLTGLLPPQGSMSHNELSGRSPHTGLHARINDQIATCSPRSSLPYLLPPKPFCSMTMEQSISISPAPSEYLGADTRSPHVPPILQIRRNSTSLARLETQDIANVEMASTTSEVVGASPTPPKPGGGGMINVLADQLYRLKRPLQDLRADNGNASPVKRLCWIAHELIATCTDLIIYLFMATLFVLYPSIYQIPPILSVFLYATIVSCPPESYWSILGGYEIFVTLGVSTSNLFMTIPQKPDERAPYSAQSFAIPVCTFLLVTLHIAFSTRNGTFKIAEARGQLHTPRVMVVDHYTYQSAFSLPSWLESNKIEKFGFFQGDHRGIDMQLVSFILDVVGFIAFFFSFAQFMGGQNAMAVLDSGVLPGPLVLVLFFLFLCMILERVAFILKSMPMKLMLHLLMTLGFMAFITKIYIMNSHISPSGTGLLFLYSKALWLLASAYQIKEGYPRQWQDPWITKNYGYLKSYIYTFYRAVPFLFEMKQLVDWCLVRTALSLREWVKLEDCLAALITIRNIRGLEDTIPRTNDGVVKKSAKLSYGLGPLLLIVGFLFGTLFFYSTLSPEVRPNSVTNIRVRLSYGDGPTLYEGSTGNYASPQDARSRMTSLELAQNISQTFPTAIAESSYIAGGLDDYFCQQIFLPPESDVLWNLSPWRLEEMAHLMRNQAYGDTLWHLSIDVELAYNILTGTNTITVHQAYQQNPLLAMHDADRLEKAFRGQTHFKMVTFNLPHFYAPLLVDYTKGVSGIPDPKLGCRLTLALATHESFLQCQPLFEDPQGQGASLSFITFSGPTPMASKTSLLQSVPMLVTFFSTVVIAFGQIIRRYYAGFASDIILQNVKNPTPLIDLITDVRLAQYEGDLRLEKGLYEEIMNIFQSPALFIEWTSPEDGKGPIGKLSTNRSRVEGSIASSTE